MAKKKSKRNQPQLQVTPPDDVTKPWYRKVWPWITVCAVIVSWFLLNGTTALSNAEHLPASLSRSYNKVASWYHTDQDWSGKWTNEGEIDARYRQSDLIDLDLLVQGRSVSGTVSSGPQQDAIPLQLVLIEGAIVGQSLDVLAFDYFQGVPKRIATFKITRVGEADSEQLKVATIWQAQPWFPKEATLWRAGPSALLEVGSGNAK
ncbi:hypothetical protein [Paraperlucidibaca baekdonensis]|uniref:hypothetical protein n=1 Tax=Paraperlucidibaca baekdonensis TaxID=748120 RepID=UPI0011C078C7|nr:hypothetical protein [Paraperlucidibaca baekdonensis]